MEGKGDAKTATEGVAYTTHYTRMQPLHTTTADAPVQKSGRVPCPYVNCWRFGHRRASRALTLSLEGARVILKAITTRRTAKTMDRCGPHTLHRSGTRPLSAKDPTPTASDRAWRGWQRVGAGEGGADGWTGLVGAKYNRTDYCSAVSGEAMPRNSGERGTLSTLCSTPSTLCSTPPLPCVVPPVPCGLPPIPCAVPPVPCVVPPVPRSSTAEDGGKVPMKTTGP